MILSKYYLEKNKNMFPKSFEFLKNIQRYSSSELFIQNILFKGIELSGVKNIYSKYMFPRNKRVFSSLELWLTLLNNEELSELTENISKINIIHENKIYKEMVTNIPEYSEKIDLITTPLKDINQFINCYPSFKSYLNQTNPTHIFEEKYDLSKNIIDKLDKLKKEGL